MTSIVFRKEKESYFKYTFKNLVQIALYSFKI